MALQRTSIAAIFVLALATTTCAVDTDPLPRNEPVLQTSDGSMTVSLSANRSLDVDVAGTTCNLDGLCARLEAVKGQVAAVIEDTLQPIADNVEDLSDRMAKAENTYLSSTEVSGIVDEAAADLLKQVANLEALTALVARMDAVEKQLSAASACAKFGSGKLPTIVDPATGECHTGFVLQDVNECLVKNGGCEHACTNTVGGFKCTCEAGHVLNGDGRTCSDVDECKANNGGCKANSKCANHKGGHTCPCNPGHSGDGKQTCAACAVGFFQPDQAVVAKCTACTATTTTSGKGSTSAKQCLCDRGYGFINSKCVACVTTQFKNTVANSVCKACPAGSMSENPGNIDVTKCIPFAWERVGTIRDYYNVKKSKPQTHYEFAIKYNGDIQKVFYNGWNRGGRLTTYPWFPQNDHIDGYKFGTVIFTIGIGGCSTATWCHNYYRFDANGNPSYAGSNGNSAPSLYARRMVTPWSGAGTLADWGSGALRKKYPDTDYEFGYAYNGDIQGAFKNGWTSRSQRVSSHWYPQGDNPRGLWLGTASLFQGLDGAANANWEHRYYRYPRTNLGGNAGNMNGRTIYKRKMHNGFKRVGSLNQIGSLRGKYPQTSFEFGLRYDGEMQTAMENGWNRGTRVTLYPFYPQEDHINGQQWGTTIFTNRLDGEPADGNYRHQYYQMNVNGYTDGHTGSHGVSNPPLYAREHAFPWARKGTLRQITAIRKQFPESKYEYGISYNGHLRHAFINGWNRGTRISLFPIYPQNDHIRNQVMATSTWSLNVDGVAANTWWHRYYYWPTGSRGGNGDGGGLAVYVRPHTMHYHALSFGGA